MARATLLLDRRRMELRALVLRHRDWLFAIALVALLQVELWLEPASVAERALAGVLVLGLLPLLAYRTRLPLLLLALFLATGVSQFWLPEGGEGEAFGLLVIVVLYNAGAHTEGRRTLVAAAIVATLPFVVAANDPDGIYLGAIVFFGLLLGSPFVVGLLIRARRLREAALEERAVALARERAERARAAVAEERTRIARELHDVVAHAVSVIVLQARGGRKLLADEPEAARHAFDTIEHTGQVALGELRRLLGALRADDEAVALAPQPSLARLEALAEAVTRAGLPVEVLVEGAPPELPPGIDVSAYRIVQEALTNALKHAGPARAVVRVRYDDDGLDIEVSDDGRGTANGDGGGHGLAGIRERVSVYGGDFEAGGRPGGGYAVRARLPFDAER